MNSANSNSFFSSRGSSQKLSMRPRNYHNHNHRGMMAFTSSLWSRASMIIIMLAFLVVLVTKEMQSLSPSISASSTLPSPSKFATQKQTAHYQIQIIIIADPPSQEKYSNNIQTLGCYGKLQGYKVIITDVYDDCRESIPSHNGGFFFRKHCTVLQIMNDEKNDNSASTDDTLSQWLMVLDADTAVINPNHRIEEYINYHQDNQHQNEKDLILYWRYHNNEVVAGNYLIKNTNWSKSFLEEWITLYDTTSNEGSYSGMNYDNGALNWLLLHRLTAPSPATSSTTDSSISATTTFNECVKLGSTKGGSFNGIYPKFTTCVRKSLLQTDCISQDWEHITILPRGKAWAYDGWLTNFRWSDSTFMHHAMKNPPIEGYDGRIVTEVQVCDESFLTRMDKDSYKVSEEELEGLFDEARSRRDESWIETDPCY